MQKANAEAAGQAATAKQAVGSELKNLASQAGAALGALVSEASPARHPGVGRGPEAGRTMDPGQRRDDNMRGMTDVQEYAPLPDETVSSNQRLATALSKRRGVGDLPRFTTDAINTDGGKAFPEIADLLLQVHASDPVQAMELFERTAQGIGAENRTRLEEILRDGGVITEAPLDRQGGQPLDGTDQDSAVPNAGEPSALKDGRDDPGKMDKHDENSCQRLKAQLEVDQANADAASNLYSDAITLVEEALVKLKAKIEERDKAILKSAPDALVGTVRAVKSLSRGKLPDAHDIPGPIGSMLVIAELNQEIAVLELAYNEAVSERAFRLRELNEAKKRAVSTFQKWQAMGCQ